MSTDIDMNSKEKIKRDLVVRSIETGYLKVPSELRKGRPKVTDWPNPQVSKDESEDKLIICYEFNFKEE